jgi:hypothetical protein
MINVDPCPCSPEPISMHHDAPPLPLVELSSADAIALIEKARKNPQIGRTLVQPNGRFRLHGSGAPAHVPNIVIVDGA